MTLYKLVETIYLEVRLFNLNRKLNKYESKEEKWKSRRLKMLQLYLNKQLIVSKEEFADLFKEYNDVILRYMYLRISIQRDIIECKSKLNGGI